MKKRIWGLVLALCMLVGCLPIVASAEIVDSGQCGDNVYWELDDNGTLTISGTGDMIGGYRVSVRVGVYDIITPISGGSRTKHIVIQNGITSIGRYAFYNYSNVKSIVIPRSVMSIDTIAFLYCSALTDVYYDGSEADWNTIGYRGFPQNTTIHYNDETLLRDGKIITDNKILPSDWAKSDIEKAIELGLIPEELQTDWQTPITRFDFCKLAHKLYGKMMADGKAQIVAPNGHFSDISDMPEIDRFKIGTIAALGIVSGYDDGTFRPYNEITRQEAAAMLMRTAKFFDDREKLEMVGTQFTDCGDCADWAMEGIKYVYPGIMKGTNEEYVSTGSVSGYYKVQFSPFDTYTREQAMVTFYRLYNIVKTYMDNKSHTSLYNVAGLTPEEQLFNAVNDLIYAVDEYTEAIETSSENIQNPKVDKQQIAEVYDVYCMDRTSKEEQDKQGTYINEALYDYTSQLSGFNFANKRNEKFIKGLQDALGVGIFKGRYGKYTIEINPAGRAGSASVGIITCTNSSGAKSLYEFNTTYEATMKAVAEFDKESGKLIESLGTEAIAALVDEASNILVGSSFNGYFSKKLSGKVNNIAKKAGLGDVNKFLGEINQYTKIIQDLKGIGSIDIEENFKSVEKLTKLEIDIDDKYLTNDLVTDAVNKVAGKAKSITVISDNICKSNK